MRLADAMYRVLTAIRTKVHPAEISNELHPAEKSNGRGCKPSPAQLIADFGNHSWRLASNTSQRFVEMEKEIERFV